MLLNNMDVSGLSTGGCRPNERATNSLRVLFWVAKASLLRIDALSAQLLDTLLSLLPHPHYGLPTARGFSILLAPNELLSASNFVTIRLLHKQRLFAHCIPKLTGDFRAAATPVKRNYLIALAGILRFLPTDLVLSQLEPLLPLLLQSIDLPDADVKSATLRVLVVTINESPKAIEEHISGLIKRLVACSCQLTDHNPPVSQEIDPSSGPLAQEALLPCSYETLHFRLLTCEFLRLASN
jgi:DNA repair/transcription protein MET18/MMS19